MTPTRRWLTPLAEFLGTEASSAAALFAAAGAAVIWANQWPASYAELWSRSLDLGIDLSLRDWVGDGLMAVFFFVVGLEIKRELVTGELRDRRAAALPAVAALGGMVVPVAIYLGWNAGGDAASGWGIPMATDIAFAVGVLAILGSRLPSGLRLFLLTLAIVDDIGAIFVIAVFYAEGVQPAWLAAAALVVAVVAGLRRLGAAHPAWYVVPALALWVCFHESGVHPTIAGVVLAALTPANPVRGRRVLEEAEHRLHPWSSFVIVPLFALSHAGVPLGADALRAAAGSPVAWGVATGLVVGNLIGITGATALAVRLGLGRWPGDRGPGPVVGVAALGGIGFTVALFVTGLAFPADARYDEATVAIFVASGVSALVGLTVLLRTTRRGAVPV